jgi:UDP-N-acetyl-D-mannosaminuronic acid transferase (WecB/TagA/CpsF family)
LPCHSPSSWYIKRERKKKLALIFFSVFIIIMSMTRPALRIVTFGIAQHTARQVSDRLCARGIDAESHVVSNTPAGDAEIARVLTSKKWDGLMIGLGVQKQPEWYERVVEVVKNANPNVPLIQHEGPNDLENAIERHFKIQLPHAPT